MEQTINLQETLTRLMTEVKEEGLSKDKLEGFHTEITYLDNLMRMEIAPLEKEEALYFQNNKKLYLESGGGAMIEQNRDRTDIEIKRMWRATEKGQRQIELSHYLRVTPKLLQSIKTRLYNIY